MQSPFPEEAVAKPLLKLYSSVLSCKIVTVHSSAPCLVGDLLEKTKIEHSDRFRADSGLTMPEWPDTRTVLSHRQGQR